MNVITALSIMFSIFCFLFLILILILIVLLLINKIKYKSENNFYLPTELCQTIANKNNK